ncbi:helix-turn-helix domain-containing protein [Conexibacter woesei]|uniref:helix-turn-helix domain-containing protein n=1 Tax=Conexibacter woesei TaxID=191495 RepID=UPI00040506B7|nr:helix-turn-helix domain-containing protein [Conexibacter woesei]
MPAKTSNKTNATADAGQSILEALTEKPGSTAAEIADATGLVRSTVGKQLAALERAGTVTRTTGKRDGGRRAPDRWAKATIDRLRPGQLDDLVMNHVRSLDEPVGPVGVARALGRSSGAVANCLTRRAKAGDLKQVSDKPRRYTAAVVPSRTQ